MKEIVTEGKTREEALAQALDQLGVTEDQVTIEQMESQQRDRFFGLLSTTIIKLKVRVIEPDEQPVEPEPVEEEIYEESEESYDEETYESEPVEDEEKPPVPPSEELKQAEADIREFLEGVLSRMDVDLEIKTETEEGAVTVYLEGEDSGMIIGKFGQTLDSLQYLTNVVIGKRAKEKTKVVIHVGDYRRRREASLRRMAKAMAYKVLKSKKKIVLAPMPPQDRRIVHLALSNFRNISTGSEGVGPDRRVVISYKS